MARVISGYLADDDTFFRTVGEADKHSAEMKIRAHCAQHDPRPVNPEKFLALIEALAEPIMDYINACKKINPSEPDTRTVDSYSDDDGHRSDDNETLE